MRLLGVAAARGTFADLSKLAAPVLAQQRAYGGWAQRDVFASDAYATGMTLWALAETGVLQPNDEAFRKGASFLLGTQAADGSWHVTSRATKFQQYFESGFPYGHDQWISTMATGLGRHRAGIGGTGVFACHRPLAGWLAHRIKILLTEARFL